MIGIYSLSGREQIQIHVDKVSSATIQNVVEFCEHYRNEPMKTIAAPLESNSLKGVIQDFYYQFTERFSKEDLYELIEAASFLDIKPLLDLCCATVGSWTIGCDVDALENRFGVVVSREEVEQEILREHEWARDLLHTDDDHS